VSGLAILLNPAIEPANHAAIPSRKDILSFEIGLGRSGKETLPEGADSGLSGITLTIGWRVCIFKVRVAMMASTSCRLKASLKR
jgi:hypothetical protein